MVAAPDLPPLQINKWGNFQNKKNDVRQARPPQFEVRSRVDPRAVLVRQIVSREESFDEVGASDLIEDDVGHLRLRLLLHKSLWGTPTSTRCRCKGVDHSNRYEMAGA
jgi:hypothetical protein